MAQVAIDGVDFDTIPPAVRPTEDFVDTAEARTMQFGAFTVCPGARALKLGLTAVPLGSRAFDLLVVLLRSRGKLVTKEEIVREVWPSTFVDESNLRFQMGVLRKALGPERDRIKTIPGRGYIFADDEDALLAPTLPQKRIAVAPESTLGATAASFIFIVEPDAAERNAMTTLLRALKISVLSFKSVEEVAAFTVAPARLAAA
ncbi:winged helix-turn-helix domain-containing protein [Sphingomonas sp. RB3P16]|uniref:winged helix-turn-helix domain-containing protein n=1 Tax=Parasphingomonas frigoris TaxID=3096163 RepID=UPI002FC68D91